jgi:hypothetical protein
MDSSLRDDQWQWGILKRRKWHLGSEGKVGKRMKLG